MQSKKLIFIFSLPRSGSTLVQRVLASHDSVATSPEPWLLLNLLASSKPDLNSAIYNVDSANRAMTSFFDDYHGGIELYEKKLNQFVYDVYENICEDAHSNILDKTPRYHCIASDIQRIFPEAKIIFLWRNPLAICSSLIESWGNGKWNLYRFYFDLFHGHKKMSEAFKNSKNHISITYEDLVLNDTGEWSRLFEYLELDNIEQCLESFSSIKIDGMGDQVGQKKYSSVSAQSVNKWRDSFNNPLRKFWARKYLTWFEKEPTNTGLYDIDELLLDLDGVKSKFGFGILNDALMMLYGVLYHALNIPMLKKRFKKILMRERVYASR